MKKEGMKSLRKLESCQSMRTLKIRKQKKILGIKERFLSSLMTSTY
jgi:hypothetical protein